jgi:hypothetical protein
MVFKKLTLVFSYLGLVVTFILIGLLILMVLVRKECSASYGFQDCFEAPWKPVFIESRYRMLWLVKGREVSELSPTILDLYESRLRTAWAHVPAHKCEETLWVLSVPGIFLPIHGCKTQVTGLVGSPYYLLSTRVTLAQKWNQKLVQNFQIIGARFWPQSELKSGFKPVLGKLQRLQE